MGFREHLQQLEDDSRLIHIKKDVSKRLEAAGILKAAEEKAVLFERIKESPFRVAGNLFPTKESIARYFGVTSAEIIPMLVRAITDPVEPPIVPKAPCQEVDAEPDLDRLPVLFHCQRDGGNYITSGVFIVEDEEWGQNVDFHRSMQIGKNKLSVRIVKNRHFDQYLSKKKELRVAVCIGNAPNVLLAAATSVERGINELCIANSLEPLPVVRAKTFDALIPADCEFVLEGVIRLDERHDEGPFVDLTETYDFVRQEPVLEITHITHRRDAVWQALLPGLAEHKILMGLPREPTIFKKVSESGVRCLDVTVNPGGCSWLHAIVKIDKQSEQDGPAAIRAAFAGHRSCKHVFVVDSDIDIYNPQQVEWAMATRFQASSDMIVLEKEKGSSLDPSADPQSSFTTKVGFDLTKPLKAGGKNFERAEFPEVDLRKYL